MDPGLEVWAREEVQRRAALHLPRPHFFEVVNDGLRALRRQCLSVDRFYYLDNEGPFFSILECLDAIGVPREERGKYWHRWDRLPKELQARITVTRPPVAPAVAEQASALPGTV